MEQKNAYQSVSSRYRCHRPSRSPWKWASCSEHMPGGGEGSIGLTFRHQSYAEQAGRVYDMLSPPVAVDVTSKVWMEMKEEGGKVVGAFVC